MNNNKFITATKGQSDVQIILIINVFYLLTKVTKTKKSGLLH